MTSHTPSMFTPRARHASDARRERGRLREHLAHLMDINAPTSTTDPIRERIRDLNTTIEREDGHR